MHRHLPTDRRSSFSVFIFVLRKKQKKNKATAAAAEEYTTREVENEKKYQNVYTYGRITVAYK